MKKIYANGSDELEFFRELDKRHGETNKKVTETVSEIIENVRENGDKAVKDYTLKFDGSLPEYYEIPRDVINDALDEADEDAMYLMEHYAHEDILMLKANIEIARKNSNVAIAVLGSVIDVNPFRTEAYSLRGKLRQELGDETGAKEDFDYAAELMEQQQGNMEQDIEKKTKEQYIKHVI